MGLARPNAHFFRIASTGTGSSTSLGSDIAEFGGDGHGFGNAMVQHMVTGTTKNFAFKLQGSVAKSGIWTDLMAATTGSTAGAAYNSTATATFTHIRVNVTANATTGNGVLNCYVAVR